MECVHEITQHERLNIKHFIQRKIRKSENVFWHQIDLFIHIFIDQLIDWLTVRLMPEVKVLISIWITWPKYCCEMLEKFLSGFRRWEPPRWRRKRAGWRNASSERRLGIIVATHSKVNQLAAGTSMPLRHRAKNASWSNCSTLTIENVLGYGKFPFQAWQLRLDWTRCRWWTRKILCQTNTEP